MAISAKKLAAILLATLDADLPTLETIDNYHRGHQNDPYMPPNADDEYKLLARRSISNWMPLVVNTPTQALYVDNFRPGRDVERDEDGKEPVSPEWQHWQDSRLDARQIAIHRGAIALGHAFTLTEKRKDGKVITSGLSALRTAAVYNDPANDHTPLAAITVTRMPRSTDETTVLPGKARMWDEKYEYSVTFESMTDPKSIKVTRVKAHGASECPVTRFAAAVDLEGRTTGVVGPMIPIQDRINQTVFDLLVTQTYSSHKVRYATGMTPPLVRDEEGNPKLDEKGNPIPIPINHNAKRFLFAPDADTRFGTLDETPLAGFIESIDMSIRHLSAVSQVPPHHLLGQIANLSAEALQAAETALSRKVEEYKKSFGESWERVFRLAAELAGETASADDASGEVIWRDLESRSLAQAADALGKMAESLGIPVIGLWERIPGVTKNEIEHWLDLKSEEPDAVAADAIYRIGSGSQTGRVNESVDEGAGS